MNMNPKKHAIRGRPRLKNPRKIGLLLKLTEAELALIEEKAQRYNKPKAAWIREVALAA